MTYEETTLSLLLCPVPNLQTRLEDMCPPAPEVGDSLQHAEVTVHTVNEEEQNKQKFKVRQPQRAAKSKRPNAPSDGSKNNGIHTTKQEDYPSRHPTTDTANSSTSKQITSRRLIGVAKSNTIQSTSQAGCPVSPPQMYHPRRPAHQPRLIPKHVAI